MKTSFQGKFNPHNLLRVEQLLYENGEQRFANIAAEQIRVEPVSNAPDTVVIYKVHAENGVFLVRFSLAKWRGEILKNEVCVVEQISPLIQIEIPETVFFPADGPIPAFTIHQWIVGEPLTTEMYLSMSPKGKRQLADDLTEFLIAVHSIYIGAPSFSTW